MKAGAQEGVHEQREGLGGILALILAVLCPAEELEWNIHISLNSHYCQGMDKPGLGQH